MMHSTITNAVFIFASLECWRTVDWPSGRHLHILHVEVSGEFVRQEDSIRAD